MAEPSAWPPDAVLAVRVSAAAMPETLRDVLGRADG